MMTLHNLIVSHSVSNCQALCRADCQDIGTRLALLHRDGGDGEESDGGGGDGDDEDDECDDVVVDDDDDDDEWPSLPTLHHGH